MGQINAINEIPFENSLDMTFICLNTIKIKERAIKSANLIQKKSLTKR